MPALFHALDDKILSLYVKGKTIRETVTIFREMYRFCPRTQAASNLNPFASFFYIAGASRIIEPHQSDIDYS